MAAIDWHALDLVQQAAEQLKGVFHTLSRSNYVPGEGPDVLPQAFVVGEAPGAQEDARRKPFVGPSGLMLRQLLRIGGLEPAMCWITNAVKLRPPRNRKPTVAEIKAFRRLLLDEWHAVGKPRLIIPVGNTALSAILGGPCSIIKMAGKPMKRKGNVVVFPMIHPSFGLREPRARELIEKDWENLNDWIKSEGLSYGIR